MVDVNYIVKKGHTAKLCLDNYDAAALVKMGPSEEKKTRKNYRGTTDPWVDTITGGTL